MSNHLKNSTSPYLLQHAQNPVDWYTWCDIAFEKAKAENKPIFLSIGYSTCHWCHVMAHESFENEKTAAFLNKHFVSIKVDREERPDIDNVYMSVCEALTGGGGWPLSIFMTWDKKPFFAGTYFPPHSKYGMPGFFDLLNSIAAKWLDNPDDLIQSADNITGYLKTVETGHTYAGDDNLAENALQMFTLAFDHTNGGFGSETKFPTPHNLLFLMLYSKLKNSNIPQKSSSPTFDFDTPDSSIPNHDVLNHDTFDSTISDSNLLHPDTYNTTIFKMVEKTLIQMRKGGIFDHIGYGFSRYSTDKYFLVPHFEKMLYDNALLIMAYSAAYSMTNNSLYLNTAQKTAEYVFREMTSPLGGFYSAQDADSDGVEGKYYTFSYDEVIRVLGEEHGILFAKTFDITPNGNFEGTNIPNLLKSNILNSDLDAEREQLYHYRKNRSALPIDDKLLLSYNSLMIAALSMFYRVSHHKGCLKAAQNALIFIEENLCEGSQLFTSFRNGIHSKNGFLDDYAFYTCALIELYLSTLDKHYLERAESFCDETLKRFSDSENGGFYLCENDSNELFVNPKESFDGAIPSGNSVMAYNLVRLHQLTGKETYNKAAQKQIAYLSAEAQEYPMGHSMFLIADMLYENPPEHITVVLKNVSDLDLIREHLPYLANITIVPESKEFPLINEQTTYYICKNHTCMPPANTM